MSLYKRDYWNAVMTEHGLCRLFYNCTGLTIAKDLKLPNTVAEYCFYQTFRSTGISTAPYLPATALANNCYYEMFINCSSLNEVRTAMTV